MSGIYRGANVKKVNGRNTQKKHIKKIKYTSNPIKIISCMKKKATKQLKI
ncbi:MAG: hypothetical protein CM1200mP13_15600 [Candidatus Pelagibacterales bacterium]|nr:MAG: hypothetical protein CM1200mP13_15600 [Pelagibacterales bacterium]